jgi:hypothetical protein
MVEGLLGGMREAIFPTQVPQGAAYDLDSMRMARAALLGNLGASLIAAGQGGQSPESRAVHLARMGQGVGQASDILSAGVANNLRGEQIKELQAERARKAAEDAFFRNSVAGIGAGGGSGLPAVAPTAAPVTSPPAGAANPSDVGATPDTPVTPAAIAARTPAPPPVTDPAAVTAAVRPGGKPTWWQQLGIKPELAVQIANLPSEQRRQVMTKLILDQATPREVWQTTQLKDGRVVQINSKTNEIRKALDPSADPPGGVPKAVAEIEGTLRNEFYRETKDFTDRQTAYLTLKDLAQRKEGVSDMTMIISLMKVYDPTSTVTGQEAATAANAPGVPEGIRSQYNMLFGGGKLSDGARQQVLKAAEQRYGQEYDAFGQRVDHFSTLAKKYGADPTRVIQDTRNPAFGKIRSVQRAAPEAIMQMSPADLRSLPEDILVGLSAQQLMAIRQRIAQTKYPQGGR